MALHLPSFIFISPKRRLDPPEQVSLNPAVHVAPPLDSASPNALEIASPVTLDHVGRRGSWTLLSGGCPMSTEETPRKSPRAANESFKEVPKSPDAHPRVLSPKMWDFPAGRVQVVDQHGHDLSPDPLDQALSELKTRHDEIKAQTEALNQRITRFQDWISTLPGRAETCIWAPAPDAPPEVELAIQVERVGKLWQVQCAYVHEDECGSTNWTPLLEAGVRVKAAVLPLLPKLVESMVRSQQSLVQDIARATWEFDRFAEKVRMPMKEGA